jgi:hypothetical protein
MGKNENTLSTRDSVGTPPDVFDLIVDILGPIGLDPCSHPSSLVPARVRFYLPEYAPGFIIGQPVSMPKNGAVPAHIAVVGNGLLLPWGGCGLVYVNPPYSNLSADPWIIRALPQLELGIVHAMPKKGEHRRWLPTPALPDEIVWLLPVRTAGSWWQHDLVHTADMITCLNFRVKHTGEPDPSPFHQCLAYRGPRARLWKEKAEKMLGWTVRPQEIAF